MKRGVITKKKPEKSLVMSLKKRAGRNNTGRITVRHKGGGARKQYRLVTFDQRYSGKKGTVSAIEYDPNRNALLALVQYENRPDGQAGRKAYIIAPHTIKVDDEIRCEEKTDVKIGNRMKLKNIPAGETVHNIELEPGRGGKLARSAGTGATVQGHEGKYTQLSFPSSEVRKILSECYATIGTVSRPEFKYERVHNAGRSRLKGIRPTVRGVVMNPVDHPHGGGEGRSGIGMKYPKTPWGKHALGVKTRTKKWTDMLIVQRRKKKKRKK